MQSENTHAAPAGRSGEVRLATFVQCDIAESTRIFNGLEFDEQRTLRRAFETTVADVAMRHGGHLVRWWLQGDGAQICFGIPQAREDAPQSAVRMALEVVQAVRDITAVADVRIEIRVGIASGDVALDVAPSGPQHVAVDGPVPAMAERMRAASEPSSIVVDDATKRLAGAFFEYKDLGIVEAKGFGNGVRAWRVVRETALTSSHEAQRYSGEIIGREEARAALSAAWDDARDGRGQTVCLVGDAGIGKSRLARTIVQRAAQDHAVVLEIDCMDSTANSPLYPIGVLLRRAAGIAAYASESDKATLASQLLSRFPSRIETPDALTYLAPLFGAGLASEPLNQRPDEVREHTISAAVGILVALAEAGAVVLCEDLHWADDTTAHVVQRLAGEISCLRVLMIVTTRPGTEALSGISNTAEISLEPLDAKTAAGLVRAVAGEAALPAELVNAIVTRSEGVPLLLEEITRNLLEASGRGEDMTIDALPGGEVPPELQLIVQSRLGRLPEYKRIVQAASVLGREFSTRLLERLLPPEQPAPIAEAIDLLASHGLFDTRDASGDRVRFKHAMIQRAVYNTLVGNDRRDLHACAADMLISAFQGTPDASPDVLARHLREARRFADAIRVRIAAMDDTFKRGAYVESAGHCEAALPLVKSVQDRDEARNLQLKLLVQYGAALQGKHRYADREVQEAIQQAQILCDERAEAGVLYPIIRSQFVFHLMQGRLAAAYALSLQALNIAEQSQRVDYRIDAMSVHSYATLYYGRLEDCRNWIHRCLKLYRQEHGERLVYPVPHDAAAAVLSLLPTVEWLLGDPEAAEEAIDDGLLHVERYGRAFDKAFLHAWTAGTRYTQRRYEDAKKHAQTAIAISHEHGFREWLATGVLMELISQAALQPSLEAVAQAVQTCKAFEAEKVALNASYYLWAVARGFAHAGDAQSASYVIGEAFRRAQDSHESRMNAELLILQAELEPNDAGAVRLLADALTVADEQGAVAISLRAAAAMVLRAGAEPAEREHARRALEVLDAKAPCPADPRWMHDDLATARSVCARLVLDAAAVASAIA
ncbi:MAG: adenylate cyclase [Betaproteobacteria bacterium]|nr:adenylate cyclase [Betaproteobacteria bacterium]